MSNVIPIAQEKQPHKQILELLKPEVDCDPLSSKYAIDCCLDGFTKEQREAALTELIDAGVVVKRMDAHSGEYRFGLAAHVEKHEAEYDNLKADVYAKAEAHGLRPKWRPGEGWRLVDATG